MPLQPLLEDYRNRVGRQARGCRTSSSRSCPSPASGRAISPKVSLARFLQSGLGRCKGRGRYREAAAALRQPLETRSALQSPAARVESGRSASLWTRQPVTELQDTKPQTDLLCSPSTTAGFLTASEALLTPPASLAKRTKLPPTDISELLLELSIAASSTPLAATQTVASLVGSRSRARGSAEAREETNGAALEQVRKERRTISLGDEGLDALLGEGVPLGSVTEVAGQS